MRCAAYYRVSTDEQGASLDAQKAGAKAWCAANGGDLVAEYCDEGVSGAEWLKRPGIVALQADVKREPRPWDVLVVRDLDRIGRDVLRMGLLLETLQEYGARVHVWSTGEEVRPGSEHRALLILKGILAEQERAQIAHRTRTGLKQRAEKGMCVGGRPYGYNLERGPEGVAFVVNEAEAAVVREIYTRRAAAESGRTIAADLNRRGVPSSRAARDAAVGWCHTQVRKIAANPRYRGEAKWGKAGTKYRAGTKVPIVRDESQVVTCPVPSIVDDALWQRAQRNTEAARKVLGGHVHRGPKAKYLLIGNACCGLCRSPLATSRTSYGSGKGRQNVTAYTCLRARDQGSCTFKPRRITRLDGVVLDWLLGKVLAPDVVADGLAKARAEAAAAQVSGPSPALVELRARVEDLEKRVARLVRAIEDSDSPDVLTNLRQRRAELVDARRALETTEPPVEVAGADEEADLLARLTDLRPLVEAARSEAPELVRGLLGALLSGPITVTPEGTGRDLIFRLKGEARPGALLDLLVSASHAPDDTRGMATTHGRSPHTTLRSLRIPLRRTA